MVLRVIVIKLAVIYYIVGILTYLVIEVVLLQDISCLIWVLYIAIFYMLFVLHTKAIVETTHAGCWSTRESLHHVLLRRLLFTIDICLGNDCVSVIKG